ncbi:hypothetical protein RI367_008856, partial [Sorochytrium milnesiophthora]
MQELPTKLQELEALVHRLVQRKERSRERDLNKRQTSFAPPRPRYEPPAPVYNSSNDVAPMVIDAIRRGKISDAERAHRFRERPLPLLRQRRPPLRPVRRADGEAGQE